MGIIARHQTRRGELALRQLEADDGSRILEIIVDGVFLMSSANGGSERALALRCLEPLRARAPLRVMVGGLGMGFTLAAVLEQPSVALVDVVEVEPLVVEWAKVHFSRFNDDALTDPRVRVVVDDLLRVVETTGETYDAILLDIDNGPTWLAAATNAELYQPRAIGRLLKMLTPGGVLGVWSSERTEDFVAALGHHFSPDAIDELVVHEQIGDRLLDFFLYRAVRPVID